MLVLFSISRALCVGLIHELNYVVISLAQPKESPGLWDIAHDRIAMISESGEKSHGQKKRVCHLDISEAVLKRGTMPGASDIAVLADRVCLLQSGWRYGYRLSNGRYQSAQCRHQTSVTAGTVLHKTHMPLTHWLLAFYFVSQDKRGIFAVQLAAMLGTTYKTAWSRLWRIRTALGQRDKTYQLCGAFEFDDAYFGGPTVGKKRVGAQKKQRFSWRCLWRGEAIPAF